MPRDNFVMQERKDKFDALMGVLKGPPGPAGKSAYQIAVDNGFVGTPEEWLASLKGPKGDKGDDGKSAYQAAVDGGYQGTEADFNAELADIEAAARAARAAADDAEAAKTGAESAASHYPKIENGNWWVYSAATGAYVDTGISAEGTQGIDGVSPAVTFAEITGGHTMTVTDKTHPDGQSINILNGQNGTDGVSPAISITDIAGGHRLTITDAAHPQGVSMDIMDGTVGPRGPAGPGVPAGGATGKVLIKKSGADYDTEWGDAGTSDALPLAGGTMSGAINMDGNKVSNLPTPTASGDAVPKGYADGLLTGYRTAAAQDLIDATKQAKIAASGMLKGEGNGGVSAAVPGTDYLAPSALAPYRTAAAQDVIDAGKAPLASPSLTGTPTAPTAAQGANSQQIATTAYADAALSNFAYVNSGDTADKAYAANELLVYKGQLYKASAAIAIGETLTPDSNITLRTIATALKNMHLKYTSIFNGGITEYTNYTLSDSLANYDIVIAEIYTQDNERKAYFLLPILNKKYDVSWNATDSVSWYIICTIKFTANTTLNVLKCSKRGFSQSNLQIYGIRIV